MKSFFIYLYLYYYSNTLLPKSQVFFGNSLVTILFEQMFGGRPGSAKSQADTPMITNFVLTQDFGQLPLVGLLL
jgi:hypothetical protein